MKDKKVEHSARNEIPRGVVFRLSRCCNPGEGDEIIAYMREDRTFSVHRHGCPNLRSISRSRLVSVTWDEIQEAHEEKAVDAVYHELDAFDFRILLHLKTLGLDYAHPISWHTRISLAETFRRLKRLRVLGVIARVQRVMIQYRKGIVHGTWVKHRNHTYYELTPLGRDLVSHWEGK